MPELEKQSDGSDPIAALHKMSTTAGVATQDYVAINALAVTAAVLGLATALAFVGTLFLILGLAALVCGAWALVQIRGSNGTQGGAWLAWLGIVLALLLAGGVLANTIRESRREAARAREATDALNRVAQRILAADYPGAYALLGQEFRDKVTLDQFRLTWINQQDPDRGLGKLLGMEGNGLVRFGTSGAGRVQAYTQAILRFEKTPELKRLTVWLEQTPQGDWQVHQMIELFDLRRRPASAQ